MREPPAVRGQHGVFTVAQAAAAGWTPSALKHAVRRDHIVRVAPGVYACPLADDNSPASATLRAQADSIASALGHRAAIISHRSAALLAGLPVLTLPPRPCVTTQAATCGSWWASGHHVHRGRLGAVDVIGVDQTLVGCAAGRGALSPDGHRIRRTRIERTVVDVAREAGMGEAVVIADAALEQGLIDPATLAAAVARLPPGGPGSPAAARAVALARSGAQSPLESMSRLALLAAGLPTADLQETIFNVHGHFLARVDFYWDDVGVVGEADGLSKYTEPQVLREEKLRQERLEQAGLIVLRWSWRDLDAIDGLVRRIRLAHERGRQRTAGDRRWQTGGDLAGPRR